MSLKIENVPVVGKIHTTFKNSKTARNVALMSAAAGGIAFVSSKAPKYISDKVKFSTRLAKSARAALLTAGIASAFVLLKNSGVIDKAVSKVKGFFNKDKTTNTETEADKDNSKSVSEEETVAEKSEQKPEPDDKNADADSKTA